MNGERFQCSRTVALLLVGGAMVWGGVAETGERGRPIEFSRPKDGLARTNVLSPAESRNALKQFEDDLSRSFQIFDPQSSLSGVLPMPGPPPPARPVIPSQRARAQMERRKNWVFAAPEEDLGILTPEGWLAEGLSGRGEPENGRGALWERWLAEPARSPAGSLSDGWAGAFGPGEARERTEARPRSSPEVERIRAQLDSTEQNMRAVFDSAAAGLVGLGAWKSPVLPNLLDSQSAPSPYQQKAKEAREAQFRQMLQSPLLAPVSPAGPPGGLAISLSSVEGARSGAGIFPSATPSGPAGPGASSTLPSLSGSPALAPVAPATPPGPRVSPSPFTELPKRRF